MCLPCGGKALTSLSGSWQYSQAEVFEALRPLVTGVANGSSASVFAYGHRMAGKSYTMMKVLLRATAAV